ncbi:MAG: IS1634 family transposase [Candidatus Aminicenantes bacterium]|jgi:transposase
MFFRVKKAGPRHYLQIVQNYWDKEKKKSRQRVLATLGRQDQLCANGRFDSLIKSAERFTDKLLILSEHEKGETTRISTRKLGSTLVFQRLWKESGCEKIIKGLLAQRHFEFDVEKAVFLSVLHRLFESDSDRHCALWQKDYHLEDQGEEGQQGELKLHHFYRAMMWLGESLWGEKEQGDEIAFSRRCTKDKIEEKLFSLRRDLFSSLEIFFFDTTSIYFEGDGGEYLGEYGHSKDHRPDRKQVVVGVVLDNEGHPVCCEIWPGNATDVKSLAPVITRLRKRFGITQLCIVADRGMVSNEVVEWLESEGWFYILGMRMKNLKEVRDAVLSRGGRYKNVEERSEANRDKKVEAEWDSVENDADSTTLKVKEVWEGDRRYIVCLNGEQACKDAHDREAIVKALEAQLQKGDKSLVGNKGFRRYLKSSNSFQIDREKIKQESRYDGKWVLRTNTDLDSGQVALKYKELWMVEQIFRSMKSLLSTRPIYHKSTEAIKGHIFCSFLAILLIKELGRKMDAKGLKYEWNEILQSLNKLEEIKIEKEGKRFLLINDVSKCSREIFAAVGVSIPPAFRQVD